MPCNVTASSSTTKTPSTFRRKGGTVYFTTYIPNTAYRIHLGPSLFDSALQTLPDMTFSFWVNFPFNVSQYLSTESYICCTCMVCVSNSTMEVIALRQAYYEKQLHCTLLVEYTSRKHSWAASLVLLDLICSSTVTLFLKQHLLGCVGAGLGCHSNTII